jgi:hypothetical protein
MALNAAPPSQLGGDLADVTCNAAEIAALHAGIDVEHRLDVGLVKIVGTLSRCNVATL